MLAANETLDRGTEQSFNAATPRERDSNEHASRGRNVTESSIGPVYLVCEKEFTNLVEELRKVQGSTQLDTDHALDQFDRLKLWAGNLGVRNAATSPISLDWRLGNAPDIKEAVTKLLRELMEAIKNCKIMQQRVH